MQANECMHALTHISLWQMHAIMNFSRSGCMNVIYITRQISKKTRDTSDYRSRVFNNYSTKAI